MEIVHMLFGLGVLVVLLVVLILRDDNGDIADYTDKLENKPSGVPMEVWEDRALAWKLADIWDVPFDPDYELAIWWRESLSEETTPDTPEIAPGEVTEIATKDVNQAFDQSFDWPPRSFKEAATISILYDKLNYQRAAKHTNSRQQRLEWMIRAHNEGPNPELDITIPYMNDVLDFYDKLKGRHL